MANTVLSTLESQSEKESWHPREGGAYTPANIEKISDPSGGNIKKLLTAIPSPFARMHLFDTAFTVVNAENVQIRKPNHEGDSIFHKMVSDCFDVLELLFNYRIHRNAGHNIEIRTWKKAIGIQRLSNSRLESSKLIGHALKLFLEQDKKTAHFEQVDGFYLLLYENQVFAASSPLSCFVTAPDMDSKPLNFVSPDTAKGYFSTIRPLHHRSDEFQEYQQVLFLANAKLRTAASSVYRYLGFNLDNFAEQKLRTKVNGLKNSPSEIETVLSRYEPVFDVNSDPLVVCGAKIYKRSVEPPADLLKLKSPRLPGYLKTNAPVVLIDNQNSRGESDANVRIPKELSSDLVERVLPDLGMKYPFLVPKDFLEENLIRVPYRVNQSKFVTGELKGFDAKDNYGFLLPIKRKYFEFFGVSDLANQITITKKDNDIIEVKILVPTTRKGVEFKRKYRKSRLAKSDDTGEIIDARLNAAVFPFYRVLSDDTTYNDFYKVMIVDDHREKNYRDRNCFTVRFWTIPPDASTTDGMISDNPDASHYFRKQERSKKLSSGGTTFYDVRNVCPDYFMISTEYDSEVNGIGIMVPIWTDVNLGSKTFAVSVDFGTTGTHVAYTNDPKLKSMPKPLTVNEQDMQVVLFSAPDSHGGNITQKYDEVENDNLISAVQRQKHEFMPTIIGSDVASKYRFPTRTALSEMKNLRAGEYDVLGNANISFVFGKEIINEQDEEIITNLKWSIGVEDNTEERINVFLCQILYMIRAKIILNEGNPQLAKVIWFYPSSFTYNSHLVFQRVWAEVYQRVFHRNEGIHSLTESEAPYYYHVKKGDGLDSKVVLCIDIGGGSTDVAFFIKGECKFATSFNFAGNAIWGTGYDEIGSKRNAVVQMYEKETLSRIQGLSSDQKEKERVYAVIQTAIVTNAIKSEDLVNLFFALDEYVDFSKMMERDGKFKIVLLLQYCSIVYHCIQILRWKKLPRPDLICFSGRGSKNLDLLEPAINKEKLRHLTSILSDKVFEVQSGPSVEILVAEDVKEATCNGGVLMQARETQLPPKAVYYGDKSFRFSEGDKPQYNKISSALKEEVVENLKQFVEIFFALNRDVSFKDNFGVNVDLKQCEELFTSEFLALHLAQGIKHRELLLGEGEEISESLFFYPLFHALFVLGLKVYGKET